MTTLFHLGKIYKKYIYLPLLDIGGWDYDMMAWGKNLGVFAAVRHINTVWGVKQIITIINKNFIKKVKYTTHWQLSHLRNQELFTNVDSKI